MKEKIIRIFSSILYLITIFSSINSLESKNELTTLNIIKFEASHPQCQVLEKGTTIYLYLDHPEKITSTIPSFHNKIMLKSIKSDLKITTNCAITQSNIKCITNEEIKEKDEFKIVLENDEKINDEITIKKYESLETIKGSPDYVELDKENTTSHIVHNYFKNENRYFLIHYLKEINELPNVIETNNYKNLYCEITKNKFYVSCFFNSTLLPFNEVKRENYVTYFIQIKDACGNTEKEIKVDVKNYYVEINVRQIIYNNYRRCNYFPINSTFSLESDNLTKIDLEKKYELEYIVLTGGRTQESVNLDCSLTYSFFECKIVKRPNWGGTYKLDQNTDIIFDEVVLKKFPYKLNNNSFEYHPHANPLSKNNKYNIEYNYIEGNSSYFYINYEYKVYNWDLPEIKLREKDAPLECHPDNTKLKCNFNETIMPPNRDNPDEEVIYNIDIYDLCKYKEPNSIEIKVKKTIGEYNVRDVDIKPDSLDYCTKLPAQTTFIMVGGTGMDIKETYNIKEIFLQLKSDHEIKVNMNCTLSPNEFNCYNFEQPKVNGEYEVVLENNIELDERDLVLNKFRINNRVFFNIESNDLDRNFEGKLNYDYADGNGIDGFFLIPFNETLKELPIIKLKEYIGYNFKCEIDQENKKNAKCIFNYKDLPAKISDPIYSIYFTTICNTIQYIDLTLKRSRPNVAISKIGEEPICQNIKNQKKLKLSYEIITEKERTWNIQETEFNADLKLAELNIPIKCNFKPKESYIECDFEKDKDFKDGYYSLEISSSDKGSFKLNSNSLNNFIYLTSKTYNTPSDTQFYTEFDYNKEEPIIKILFNEELQSDSIPHLKSKVSNKDIECDINSNNKKELNCKIKKEEFPYNSYYPEECIFYEFYLINVCEFKENTFIKICVTNKEVNHQNKVENNTKSESTKKVPIKIIIIVCSVIAVALIIIIFIVIFIKKNKRGYRERVDTSNKISRILEDEEY